MERDSAHPSTEDATAALTALAADRHRLADSVRVPRELLAALGATAAWWVGGAATTQPGAGYEPPSTGWLALAGALVVAYLVRRETGVRFRAMGARAAWATTGILAACLTLFSVSLGLVAAGAPWAVGLTSVTAFAVTWWLAGVAYHSAAERLRGE